MVIFFNLFTCGVVYLTWRSVYYVIVPAFNALFLILFVSDLFIYDISIFVRYKICKSILPPSVFFCFTLNSLKSFFAMKRFTLVVTYLYCFMPTVNFLSLLLMVCFVYGFFMYLKSVV